MKTIKGTPESARRGDILELADNVPISQLERREEQVRQQEEELDWMEYVEYLVNHEGDPR